LQAIRPEKGKLLELGECCKQYALKGQKLLAQGITLG